MAPSLVRSRQVKLWLLRLRKLQTLLLAGLALGLTYLLAVIVLRWVGLDAAHAWIEDTGFWAPLVFFGVCTLSLVMAPLSGSSIFVVGGALLGKPLAFGLSFAATLVGCSLNFWIARHWGRRVAERLVGKKDWSKLNRLIHQLEAHQSVVYMIPLMPLSQDVVSYAVGLTAIRYRYFLVALVLSGWLIVGAYVVLGSSLLEWLIQR